MVDVEVRSRVTSVVLSKVLLLCEDDRITDPSILQQLKALI
jgi:hypothetical protein